MTGLEWALLSAITVLAVLVLGGLLLGARTLRRIGAPPGTGPVAAADPAVAAETDRQEQSLAALRTAAVDAAAAVE
ncbi:MAG TPA: ribonuclease Y, partial [Pilimelia sp.]|nr:ribonuclease Y [Pilimelia sp.]